MNITQERLQELLRYDPETGEFFSVSSRPPLAAGAKAGTVLNTGYCRIRVDGIAYQAHRLAWMYVHGVWPNGQLDHINRVRHDNRIENLRVCTASENQQNQGRPHAKNRCGLLGVHKVNRRFRASIRIGGVRTNLGYFDTAEIAHEAYLAAKREHHPGAVFHA